jgi:hypothetical protein
MCVCVWMQGTEGWLQHFENSSKEKKNDYKNIAIHLGICLVLSVYNSPIVANFKSKRTRHFYKTRSNTSNQKYKLYFHNCMRKTSKNERKLLHDHVAIYLGCSSMGNSL